MFYDGLDSAKFHPEDLRLNLRYLRPSWFLKTRIMGVMALKVLNESCRYPKETLELIAGFQNPNGGLT